MCSITNVKCKPIESPLESAIDQLGGVSKLASALGVGQSAVSNWRARGTTLNAAHCLAIERATAGAVTRRDLRPEDWHLIWPDLVGTDGAPEDIPLNKEEA